MLIVGNPRNIPAGQSIISIRKPNNRDEFVRWLEGDEFIRPSNMTDESLQHQIDQGFLIDTDVPSDEIMSGFVRAKSKPNPIRMDSVPGELSSDG